MEELSALESWKNSRIEMNESDKQGKTHYSQYVSWHVRKLLNDSRL